MILKVIIFLIVMSFVYTLIAIYIECTEQNKNEYSDFEVFKRVVKKLFFDFDIFKKFFFTLKKSHSKKVLLNIIENININNNIKVIEEDIILKSTDIILMKEILKNSKMLQKEDLETILKVSSLKLEVETFKNSEKNNLKAISKRFNETAFSAKDEIFLTTIEDKLTKSIIRKIKNFNDETYNKKLRVC